MPLSAHQDIQLIQANADQLSLVNKFYKACRYKSKTDQNDLTFVLIQTGNIIAAARIQPKIDDDQNEWLFLRAMVVMPELRGTGIGSEFLELLKPVLSQSNSYCYADKTLVPFYQQAGFEMVDIELTKIPYFMKRAYLRYKQSNSDLVLMVRAA
jgi:predicted GNAT family N-acyltransferase